MASGGVLLTIQLLGLNYRTANLDLRSRLALSDPQVREVVSELAVTMPEAVVLSTCNRTEMYAVLEGDASGILLRTLADHTGVAEEEIRAQSYTLGGEEAVHHLFSVAAGLDSLVVGEGQILGQVRHAWDVARAAGTTGSVLNTLFRYALQAAKEIHSQTVVARGATSVAHAAVELARKEFGTLTGRNVLVLGAGDTGRIAALNLISAGVGKLTITNRTLERAQALAAQLDGEAVPFDQLPSALKQVDLLVTASSSPEPLISAEMLEEVAEVHRDSRLLIVDVAVPRNVDAFVRKLPGVSLYDMDDIQRLCERNLHARSMAARRAQRNIAEWGERFAQWQRERDAVPLIMELRAHAEQVRQEELQQTLRMLPDLSEQQRAAVESMSRAMTNRLMHQPLIWLKQHGTTEQRQVLGQLWTHAQKGSDEDADTAE